MGGECGGWGVRVRVAALGSAVHGGWAVVRGVCGVVCVGCECWVCVVWVPDVP